jgi:hypothetical protein
MFSVVAIPLLILAASTEIALNVAGTMAIDM